VGRRPAFLTFQAGAAIMVIVFAQLTGPLALLIGGAIMGVFVNGMLGGYIPVAPYWTRLREVR
jgi:hypothetical protein